MGVVLLLIAPAMLRAEPAPVDIDPVNPPSQDDPAAHEQTLFVGGPVSESELARTTGRENSAWMSATTTNNAVVSNNQVGDNSTTGGVALTDNAFQNVSGISMVNVNTGNNSSINAAMSVNLQITYAQPNP